MKKILFATLALSAAVACNQNPQKVTLITVDPGHFHAALVQKSDYPQINPDVYVYAPEGADVQAHLARIDGFNTREENPTHWNEIVYTGEDFLEKMVSEKKGNVVMTAGNNSKKPIYIKTALEAGMNVLADKPMAINTDDFETLKADFATAEKNGVLLYDVMTERFEITTILQRELSLIPEIYGEQVKGSAEDPGMVTESVHHFFKNVAGNKLTRPAWYYDVKQQGEGLVDVTVHLVDIVQWDLFPGQIINYENDVKMVSAKHWPTIITPAQFEASTGYSEFPEYLASSVKDGNLEVYANGEMTYSLKDVFSKVIVIWNYEAPAGTGDTHFCVMRGTKANLAIRQGAEQNYIPELYIETSCACPEYAAAVEAKFAELEKKFPGIALEKIEGGWKVNVPAEYRNGHEAHFAQVTKNFLQYLEDGKLPEWEVPNMIAKYYTTTQAYKMAQE